MLAYILMVALQFSPSFGYCRVSVALTNSKAVTMRSAVYHNSAVIGLILSKLACALLGPSRPSHLVGCSPDRLRLLDVAQDRGAAGDRQVGFVVRIDEHDADIGSGLDLISFGL